jgi:pyruvate/2-oxoglutarate dehydrogenase complex dihydrolipoamide acyltransferase (E2) component
MKLIEEVQIPLLAVPPPDTQRLVEWHVRDGEHVTIGQPLFDLEVGEVIYSVESFFTGFIKIHALAGRNHAVGDVIASMFCAEERKGYRMVGIELSHSHLSLLDELRGESPRREFLWKFVCEALEQRIQANKPCDAVGDKPTS